MEGVHLTVPASRGHVRVARLTAVAVAERLGFDVKEIEDVRVAVDELANALIAAGPISEIAFEFAHLGDVLVAEASAIVTTPPQLSAIARRVLGVVVDGFELSEIDGFARFRAIKYRRHADYGRN
jgi:hypothetical protein